MYEVQVQIVQLQVLESHLTCRHHVVTAMVSAPGSIDIQYLTHTYTLLLKLVQQRLDANNAVLSARY